MNPLFEVRNVSKNFYDGPIWQRSVTRAVDNVSLTLPDTRPTITGIVGESGSGKTTLAMLLLGHLHPSSGQIFFRGQDLAMMSRNERFEFRRVVQPIFQDPFAAFNPFYRVDHVLTTPIARFRLATSEKEARQRIGEALELVGLRPSETLGRFPHQLSGGQRQRIMVARAMLCRPKLIVADEPVSMVDASLRATILDGLQTLNRDFGISIVYITHDLTTAYQVCDNVIVMYGGSIVEAGHAESIIHNPQHPYTQLLVTSIPLVDRSQHWDEDEVEEPVAGAPRVISGCKFAPRCRFVMEDCWQAQPPLYRVGGESAAACILHRDGGALTDEELVKVLE